MILLSAILVFVAATIGLFFLIEPIPTWYYQLAWWSYIVAVDSWNRRLAGRSLLRDQTARFWGLSAVSVAWWTLFEAINLRLGNWYYVMDAPQRSVRWIGGVIAFATVLPGIVETFELIGNLGWLRSVKVAALSWTRGKEMACLGFGATSLVLPLIWPDLFFPLVWCSFIFLLEPWNRRRAPESFLRDLERGEAGPFCRALLAGLVCGILWEQWNYWARTKWIYTVPVVGQLKLFEMPLLGFLGFPPFAIESLVLIRWLDTLWGRAVGSAQQASRRWGLCAAAGVLALAAMLRVFQAADRITVDSYYWPVERLDILGPDVRRGFTQLGVSSPEQLLRILRTRENLMAFSQRSGLTVAELRRARDQIRLVLHRGLGLERAHQLERLGIRTVEELAGWQPDQLAAALRFAGDTTSRRLLERRVRVWLRGLPRRRSASGSAAGPPAPGAVSPGAIQ